MASLTISTLFRELPLEQDERLQDILKLANHLKLGKNVQVSFFADASPRTGIDITTSFFMSGSVAKYIAACMQFFDAVVRVCNFSNAKRTITLSFDKDWLIKPLIEGIRAHYETVSPGDQVYLTPVEGGYAVCLITQVLNYFHQLTGPRYTTLLTCYEKADDSLLVPVDQQRLELLRLIAPSRDIDKDTLFMWQVAPLSGVLDSSGDEEHDKSELVRVRDALLDRSWIHKSEGNYEVTEAFKEINVYNISREL